MGVSRDDEKIPVITQSNAAQHYHNDILRCPLLWQSVVSI